MRTILTRWSIPVFVASLLLTSCSTKSVETSALPNVVDSPTPIAPSSPALSRSEDIQISLDIACEYVRDGFAYDGSDLIDAEVSFDVAADIFREVVIDYPLAQEFMNGAIAASDEIHRWSDGWNLLQGAKNATYIRDKEADAIVSTYNYCVASDLSQRD